MPSIYFKWPVSLVFFPLAALIAIFNIATPWAIGLYLLFSPFWVGIAFNLGFAGLALESAIGRISPLWIIAPLAWFAGYGIYAFQAHTNLAALRAEIPLANARASVDFDGRRDSLILRGDGLHRAAGPLIEGYDLHTVFEEDRSIRAETGRHGYRAWRVETQRVCDEVSRESGKRGSFGLSWAPRNGRLEGCLAAMPDTPRGNFVEVEAVHGPSPYWGLPGEQTRITLKGGEGETHLTGLKVNPVYWFPMPIAYCDFFRRTSPVKCGIFWYSGYDTAEIGLPVAQYDPVPAVAGSLKLAPRKGPAKPSDPDESLARLAGKAATGQDPAGLLEAFLRNPKINPRQADIDDLARRQSLLTPRAARLADAAITAARADNDEASRSFQQLLAGLHPADFGKVAPGVIAGFIDARPTPRGARRSFDAAFVRRLGDLGENGLPLLQKIIAARQLSSPIDLEIAYCRAGARIRSTQEGHLVRMIEGVDFAELRPASRKVLAVSALRIGRPDLADRVDGLVRRHPPSSKTMVNKDISGVDWARDFPVWRANVGPQSSPDVCEVPHFWYD